MAQKGRRNADEQLLIALACGSTVENAAKKAGIAESTVYRRLRDQEFQQRLDEVRRDMVERASSMLTAAAMEAVRALVELLGKDSPPATRLGAARAVLEIGLRMREAVDLEQRLHDLEAMHEQASGPFPMPVQG